MKAFCSGIGILLLEMKPGKALTGSLPFCAIRYEWQENHSLEQKAFRTRLLGESFYFRQSRKQLVTCMSLACSEQIYSRTPSQDFKELLWIQRVASSGERKLKPSLEVEQHYGQGQLYLRSDSGQPNPPGSNLQSTDSLAQAGLDRADSDLRTDVYRCYTVQMSCYKRRRQAGREERPDGCSKRISW